MARELNYTELKKSCPSDELGFETTGDLQPITQMIGQKRAASALEFGLSVKMKGYNIYVSGLSGTGKTTFAKQFAEKIAKTEERPSDLCYIYNFNEPKYPKLLKLQPGNGKLFKEDMEEMINVLTVEIPKIFSDKEFDEQKNAIVKVYEDKRDDVIKQITEDAKMKNFGVKMTNTGIYFMPLVDGEIISEEQFDALSEEEKEAISEHSEDIQEQAAIVMRTIKEFDKDTRKQVEDLEYSVGLFTVGRHISKLQDKYENEPEVLAYLLLVKEDILDNIGNFTSEQETDEEDYLQNIVPWMSRKNKDDFLSKYKINVLADNSETEGAPVVVSFNPTYSNLVGEVEYDSEFGNFTTDYMKIKSGLLHKANGGYLVLQAYDVLTNPHVWDTLKKAVKTKELTIETLREYSTGIAVSSLKPDTIGLDVKVIIVGSSLYYEILRSYDDDFQKLFKINASFDYEMDYSTEHVAEIAGFIKKFVKDEGTLDFDCTAVSTIVEYSARLAESQKKLTTQFDKIWEVLVESTVWATKDSAQIVSGQYVKKAIVQRDYRLSLYEEKLSDMIENDIVMIDTVGQKTGQINGLAVIDTGDYVFAKPTRITATTYVGKSGIVNIEKEAEMSGEIHDKGIQIIIGYLGQTYAQEFPLSLSCRICFEQNYSGIDGDSASSTELYSILSSLSDLPINQEIAVTGSINQRGEIQPIGGVTYKIEGFFDLCRKRGLTGTQGVIIPAQNVSDLALNDAVIDAVKDGKFHIYSITSVDEGIEILTGVAAGERNDKGKYMVDTVHGKAYRRLKDFFKKSIME